MLFYYLVFFVILLLSQVKEKQIYFAFICTGIILFCIAAFRNGHIDRDYQGYLNYFNRVLESSWIRNRIEPSFVLISKMVGLVTKNGKLLIIIYAFLGVLIKFVAIKRLSPFILLSVLVYFSNFFLLQEMTQIRAAVATGFFLLSIPSIVNKKLPEFLFFATLAFFFHFSSIILFPLYFLNATKINKNIYALLIPFGYILYFAGLKLYSFIYLIPSNLIQYKLQSYLSLSNVVNIFNYVFLSRCLLAYLFLWKSKLISEVSDLGIVLIKIYIIGLFIFIGFARIPNMSHRASEFLVIVEIILIPMLIAIIKQKKIAVAIVVSISLVFLTFSLFYSKLLTGYLV